MSRRALIFLIALTTALSLGAQTPIFVAPQATGAGNGTSWTDAYTDLQAALTVTTTGEIWVAAGTYHAGAPGNQAASFQLMSGLQIYGGFSGVETMRDQRDPTANPTVLSGDIDQNDVFALGREWWRPNWNFNAGNSHRIVDGSGADQTARLDGFQIVQGRSGPGGGFGIGGSGFYCVNGDPTIANCAFSRCAFGEGATAYLQNSTVTFEHCDFDDGYTAGEDTSGVYLAGGNVVDFSDCRFRNHYCVVYSWNVGGAALFIDSSDQVTIKSCEFSLNRTGCFYASGQPDAAYGGGIYNKADGTTVDESRFIDNEAHGGAAIYTWGEMTIRNCVFHDNFVHSYPINSAVERGDTGAGIMTRGSSSLTTRVLSSTFQGNRGGKGVCYALGHVIELRNSIVWDNIGTDPGVFILKINVSGDTDEEYSCIQGILTQEPGEDPPDPANFPGCIDIDPMFLDAANQDFRLADGSPGIDAGDDGLIGLPPFDLDGRPRLLYAHTDMGAHEYLPESFAGDVRDAQGDVVAVLGLNGGDDFVTIPVGGNFSFEMTAPPLAPGLASFAIAGFAGLPTPNLSIALPFGIGPFAFTPPALSPGLPGIFTLTDNLFGSPGQLLGSAPAPWFYTVVGGLPFAATVTFQGVIIEDGTQLKSTNAVVLVVN